METLENTPRIRLTVPFWGAQYANRVVELTLPALLSPDNLPALASEFPVEISLVTEEKLFDFVSSSRAFKRLKEYSTVRLVALDDLLTGVAGDYGPVLTYALIRGYEDLGDRMLDYYLMFLNADFIVANGSYRTLVRLIKEGNRVIHSPSLRGIYEEVVPVLAERLDRKQAVLNMAPRELVEMALRHKHVTVKARIVNQKLTHQWRMDQFYWYVDESTLIGYQWPIALVALRPERVVTKPKLMFDYGFIPDICPTAQKYYIRDSDDFFMLEPQRMSAGRDQVRLGWISPEAIAADLSLWTTKEHRDCGQQMHVFHSGDLPDFLPGIADKSKKYMDELISRLGPPNPYIDHPLFKKWWSGVIERMDAKRRGIASDRAVGLVATASAVIVRPTLDVLRKTYRWLFGGLPKVYRDHPLWLETQSLCRDFEIEEARGARILWVSEAEKPLYRLAMRANTWISRADLLLYSKEENSPLHEQPYDACFFELSVLECEGFRQYYRAARQFTRHGGRIYLSLVSTGWRTVEKDDVEFCEAVLPDTDESEAHFSASAAVLALRNFHYRYVRWNVHPLLRPWMVGALMILLAPFVYVANRRAERAISPIYQTGWMHMLARFRVVRSDTPNRSS